MCKFHLELPTPAFRVPREWSQGRAGRANLGCEVSRQTPVNAATGTQPRVPSFCAPGTLV